MASVTVIRLPAEGQYATTGSSISYMNDSLSVAQKLPRLPSAADTVYVTTGGGKTGLQQRHCAIRPEKLRQLLRSLIEQSTFAWRSVEVDDAVLEMLTQEVEKDTAADAVTASMPADEGEAAPREESHVHSPDAAHVLMEMPTAVDAAATLRQLVGDDAPAPPPPPAQPSPAGAACAPPHVDTLQPPFTAASAKPFNEFEAGTDFWPTTSPHLFRDGEGGPPSDKSLSENDWVHHAPLYHN